MTKSTDFNNNNSQKFLLILCVSPYILHVPYYFSNIVIDIIILMTRLAYYKTIFQVLLTQWPLFALWNPSFYFSHLPNLWLPVLARKGKGKPTSHLFTHSCFVLLFTHHISPYHLSIYYTPFIFFFCFKMCMSISSHCLN